MRDSDTYQAILDEGREEGRAQGAVQAAQSTLLRQGRRRFGEPHADTQKRLLEIADLERLDRLSDNLLDVSTWDELLARAQA